MTSTPKSIIRRPTVALVGRTNVGKSTLFNKFVEEAKALVSPTAGTTRSPNYGEVIWRGRVFTTIDTGGLERRSDDPFEVDIRRQAERAMKEADVILFVVDLRIGLTPEDRTLGKLLARSQKPVILVGNKADRDDVYARASDDIWNALGFDACHPVSAVTGRGVGDLLDQVFESFTALALTAPTVEEAYHPIRVVIVGKPNVGKSSLLNTLVGAPRAVVSEIAHTTREPQDTLLRWGEQLFLLVDTAGIRKKMKVADTLEAAGVRKTLEVIKRADIALFVIDLVEGIGAQDRHLAGLLVEAKIGVLVVANKWDRLPNKKSDTPTRTESSLRRLLPFLDWAPILFVSAKTGEHAQEVFPRLLRIDRARKQQITESALSHILKRAIVKHRPSRGKGVRHPYIYSIKQTGIEPPTFMIAVRGRRDSVHSSYLRFLERQLRGVIDFEGTPVVVQAKAIRPTI